MPKYAFYAFITAMCLLAIGCSTQSASTPGTTNSHQEPVAITTPTQFIFSIPQGQKVSLLLLANSNIDTLNNEVGRLYFYDDNCTLGHQVSLAYQQTPSERLTLYFAQEIQWGNPHQLILEWNNVSNNLRVQLDDQVFNIKPNKKPRFLKIHNSDFFTFDKITTLTN